MFLVLYSNYKKIFEQILLVSISFFDSYIEGNKMVKHIVFFKLENPSEENKKSLQSKIIAMKGKIDYLIDIDSGVNFSPEERAYDVALLSDFSSKEDLKRYATDPIHLEVIAHAKSLNVVTKVVDYEY